MDTAPWHAERSFLKSRWYQNDSYSTVLPHLQRLPIKEPLPELSTTSFKDIPPRPYSAEVCHRRPPDPAAEPFCRIRPLPARMPQIGKGVTTSESSQPKHPVVEVVNSPFFEAAFSDEAKLAELLSAAPATKSLRLASHHWLSPDFLVTLGTRLPRLQELNLSGTLTTDAVVAAVVAGCQELRVLDLGECELLQNISTVSEIRELRELRLPRCINAVTSEFVGSLQSSTRLEVLDLSFCPNLDSQGLQELATACRSLRWLSLTACARVTDEGVFAVTSHNAGIEHLALALNVELTDQSTSKAIRCLKRLRHLDISGCPQLSRQTPLALSKHCEYIEDISLASNSQLSDEELKPILLRCVRLRTLDLSACASISAELIIEGLTLLPELHKLVLTSVPSISDELVAYLRRRYPGCTFERHVRKHVDPDDVSYLLRMPPKDSILQPKMVKKPPKKMKKGKAKARKR